MKKKSIKSIKNRLKFKNKDNYISAKERIWKNTKNGWSINYPINE